MGLLDTLKGLFGGKVGTDATDKVSEVLGGTPLEKVGDMVNGAQSAVAEHAETLQNVAEQVKKVTPDAVDTLIDKGTDALTGGTDSQTQK